MAINMRSSESPLADAAEVDLSAAVGAEAASRQKAPPMRTASVIPMKIGLSSTACETDAQIPVIKSLKVLAKKLRTLCGARRKTAATVAAPGNSLAMIRSQFRYGFIVNPCSVTYLNE